MKKRNDLEIEVKHLLEEIELRNEDILKLDSVLKNQKEEVRDAIKALTEENEILKEQTDLASRKTEVLEKEKDVRKSEAEENQLLKKMKELKEEIVKQSLTL